MNTISATVGGVEYTAEIDGDRVTISAGGILAGVGVLRAGRIEDCAAPLGDDVYRALESAVAVELQALESAGICREHGWFQSGGEYALGMMSGDREALETRLGRQSTRGERFAFEARVRALLAVAPVVRWQDVALWSLDGSACIEGDTPDGRVLLAEYRLTDSITGWWLADPALYTADCRPISGEGPRIEDAGPRVDQIDWTGFES